MKLNALGCRCIECTCYHGDYRPQLGLRHTGFLLVEQIVFRVWKPAADTQTQQENSFVCRCECILQGLCTRIYQFAPNKIFHSLLILLFWFETVDWNEIVERFMHTAKTLVVTLIADTTEFFVCKGREANCFLCCEGGSRGMRTFSSALKYWSHLKSQDFTRWQRKRNPRGTCSKWRRTFSNQLDTFPAPGLERQRGRLASGYQRAVAWRHFLVKLSTE